MCFFNKILISVKFTPFDLTNMMITGGPLGSDIYLVSKF
jgi:hypothetical protein